MRTGKTLKFLLSEEGATAIEYSVVATGIALAILSTLSALSDSVTALYSTIAASF